MNRATATGMLFGILFLAIVVPVTLAQPPAATKEQGRAREDRQQREKSLRAIAEHLGVGAGAVIADIGAGNGPDSWVFADIVGANGKVFAEEIDEAKVNRVKADAEKRGLPQVEAVLGKTDDPCLPANCVDMAFMHFVYHHLTQPREMLDAIWKSLKPNGLLVIVDQRLGTLKDWVPREARGDKHYWISETTVVREAREQGFGFVQCADSLWHEEKSFVMVFQRPPELSAPGQDPDPLPPITESTLKLLMPTAVPDDHGVAFIALGDARNLIAPILRSASCQGVDIVLEEWATTKDERPQTVAGVSLPSVLTEQGVPQLGPEPLAAVYFLDSYHLLFHGPKLLAELRGRLAPAGRVFILDRKAPRILPHRQASHRRMIAVETVRKEMADAGFQLLSEEPSVAPERFLLVFGKAEAGESK